MDVRTGIGKTESVAKNIAKTRGKFERPLAALRIQMKEYIVVEDSDDFHGNDRLYGRELWSCWENWRWSTNS